MAISCDRFVLPGFPGEKGGFVDYFNEACVFNAVVAASLSSPAT